MQIFTRTLERLEFLFSIQTIMDVHRSILFIDPTKLTDVETFQPLGMLLHLSATSEKKRFNNIIAHMHNRTKGTEQKIERIANPIFPGASLNSAEAGIIFKKATDTSLGETREEISEEFTAVRRIPSRSILSMQMTAVHLWWLLRMIKLLNGHAVNIAAA
jgi:hypothetical protein